MTILRPASLPVVYPPAVSHSMPGYEESSSGSRRERQRNASLDVPLLQRTLATLQEQVQLMTPPESVGKGPPFGTRTRSRSGSVSTKAATTSGATQDSKIQDILNGMFDQLLAQIGQKVEISAFADAIESLLMSCLHEHRSRLMLLSSPAQGKHGVHSWTLVAQGTGRGKWRRRKSGAFDSSSAASKQLRARTSSSTKDRDVVEGNMVPDRFDGKLADMPPKSREHSQSLLRGAERPQSAPPPPSVSASRPQGELKAADRRPLRPIEEDTQPLKVDMDPAEWHRLMLQRQQQIDEWRRNQCGDLVEGRTTPSTYLRSSNVTGTSAGNSARVNTSSQHQSSSAPPPTAYYGSSNGPSSSCSGSLLSSLARTTQDPSAQAHLSQATAEQARASRVEYSDPRRPFGMRVPFATQAAAAPSDLHQRHTTTTMYYTANTHPPTNEPPSGMPSTMYYTAPTHQSGEPSGKGHMQFAHDHFDVPVQPQPPQNDKNRSTSFLGWIGR